MTPDPQVRMALLNAWHRESAESSLERWLQVCAQEQWGEVPNDLPALARVFGASWYFTRFLFFRGPTAARLFDAPPAADYSPQFLRRRLESALTAGGLEERLEQLRIGRNEIMLLVLVDWLKGRLEQERLEQILSTLAEVVVRIAMRLFELETDGQGPGMAVLGMGRLAGGEMTFGSDLDLIFLYGSGEGHEPVELSRRVRRFLRQIAAATPAGTLYEVDMRLRPHGNAGALLTSIDSFVQYHAAPRDTWERQMMTRCRPLGVGDGAGFDALAAVRRHVYQKYDGSVLRRDIAAIRIRVERELGRPEGKIELKRGRGGIMDIDFIAHYLQLAYGYDHPGLQVCSTRQVLRTARAAGLIGQEATRDLLDGYEYLKRMETCLRLFDLKSISSFAVESAAGRALARAMHGAGTEGAELLERYRGISEGVRRQFESLLCGAP